MNHCLRFVSPAILAAGVSLSLPSCSSTKIEPLVANSKHQITYEVRIFDVPVGHDFGDKPSEILNAAEAEKLIGRIKQEPTFLMTTGGRFGEEKTVTNRKEFIFPTAYEPPKFAKPIDGGNFPVTPATPTDFETTEIGTTVSLTGSQDSLSVDLDRKVFLGFVNYGTPITTEGTDFFGRNVEIIITENKIELPRFYNDRKTASTKLKEGEFLVIRNPKARAVNPGKFPFTERRPPGFIAFIRATPRSVLLPPAPA